MKWKVVMLVTLVLVEGVRAQTVVSVDGTPGAAIESFFAALRDENTEVAQSFLMAPEKMAEYCQTQVNLYAAFRNFSDVAIACFGEEGEALRMQIPATMISARLAQVQPEVDGDTAIWRSNPNAPMRLQRVDGDWKLNMYASYQKPAQIELTNATFQRITNYIDEIAAGMSDGKFATVQDVRHELKRQRALMNEDMASQLQKH